MMGSQRRLCTRHAAPCALPSQRLPLPGRLRAPNQVLAAYSGRLDGGTHDGGAGDEDAPAREGQAEAGSRRQAGEE